MPVSHRPLETKDYKTFISVPVATSAEIFGLLTLDALHVGDLKQEHMKQMLLLAQLLGIALASNANNRFSTNSTTSGRQPNQISSLGNLAQQSRQVLGEVTVPHDGGSISLDGQGAVGTQLP
jgi:transcriptional regulator with GAF, ATPase, and Fis domain